MSLPWRALLTMAFAALVSGCSVSAYQYDMLRDVAVRLADRDPAGPHTWKLRFGTLETTVEAISVEQGTLFAHPDGLRIGFDGWDVVGVRRLPGTLGPISVEKRGTAEPRIHHAPGLDATFEVLCEAPQRTMTGWLTACRHEVDGRSYQMEHRIRLDDAGRIMRIEAALLPGARPMILERINAR